MKILISHNIMWVWFESALLSYIPLIEPNSKNEDPDQSQRYVGLIWVCALFLYPIKRSLIEKNEDSDQSQRYVGLIWVCTLFLYPIKSLIENGQKITEKMNIPTRHHIFHLIWVCTVRLYSHLKGA